jgi:SAM-dependent methyltransferase
MDEAGFDKFAEDYSDKLDEAIRFSGEEGDYFDRYKFRCLDRWVVGAGENLTILDFGCGTGALAGLLAEAFPLCEVYGVDVSEKIIQVARKRFSGVNNLSFSTDLPPDKGFDVIYSANVFHHIRVERRQSELIRLRSALNPGGKLVIFEHNPWNPLTLYVVKTCPFDVDARLIRLGDFMKSAGPAGLKTIQKRYIVFFPRFLNFLRSLEARLGFLPIGAQYMLVLTHSIRPQVTAT